MAMPTTACPALQRRTVSPNSDVFGKQSLYPDSDRHQDFIIFSLAHCQPSLKISCKSIQTILRKVDTKERDKQTDRQTHRQTDNDEKISSLAEATRYLCIAMATSHRPLQSERSSFDWSYTVSQKSSHHFVVCNFVKS